jgi:hypothetical protein
MSTPRPNSAWTCVVVLINALAGCATYEKCGLQGCPGDAGITAKIPGRKKFSWETAALVLR